MTFGSVCPFLICIIGIFCITANAAPKFLPGYVFMEQHQAYYKVFDDHLLRFEMAALRCRYDETTLFYPKTKEEFEDVMALFKPKTLTWPVIDSLWIGVHDSFETEALHTSDGGKAFFAPWKNGESNLDKNKRWMIAHKNNVVEMVDGSNNYYWACKKSVVCDAKRPKIGNYTVNPEFRSAYAYYKNSVYSIEGASLFCLSDGAELFYPDSEREAKYAFDLAPRDVQYLTVGLHDFFLPGRNKMINGKEPSYVKFDHHSSTAHGWGVLQKDATIQITSSNFVFYRNFVCKKNLNRACAGVENALLYSDESGGIYEYNPFEESFAAASERCQRNGGTLAMPKRQRQLQAWLKLFNLSTDDANIWLGFRRTEGDKYTTMTDKHVKVSGFTWTHSPNKTHRCGVLSKSDLTTDDCDAKKGFICQMNTKIHPKDFKTADNLKQTFVIPPWTLSWYDANKFCAKHNATLAFPMDNVDVNFLASAMNSSKISSEEVYVGYHHHVEVTDDTKEFNGLSLVPHNIRWSTPPHRFYSFCVGIGRDARLRSVDCDKKLHFVCQRDKAIPDYIPPKYESSSKQAKQEISYKLYETKVSYKEAILRCEYDSAELFYPMSKEEGNEVFEMIKDSSIDRIQIGVRFDYNGGWATFDGERNFYCNWAPNMKNDSNPVVLNRDSTFSYAANYNEKLPFVCRRRPTAPINCARETNIGDDFVVIQEFQAAYKYHFGSHDVESANVECRSFGGAELFLPQSEAEVIAVQDRVLPAHENDFKIGVHDSFKTGYARTIHGENEFYAKWRRGEPAKGGYWAQVNDDGTFTMPTGINTGSKVCKRPMHRACALRDSGAVYDEVSGTILDYVPQEAKYPDAERRCRSMLGGLALPKNERELDAVLAAFRLPSDRHHFWLGFYKNPVEGTYHTLTGDLYTFNITTASKPTYERCGVVDSETGKLDVLDCTSKKPYFCQIDYLAFANFTERYVVSPVSLTWYDAWQYCRSRGSELALPEGDEERRLLLETLASSGLRASSQVFLGYNRLSEDNALNVSRSMPEGLNWAEGHPTSDGESNCVAVKSNGEYANIDCRFKRKFVCDVVKSKEELTYWEKYLNAISVLVYAMAKPLLN